MIALKDVRNFEMQAEEPVSFGARRAPHHPTTTSALFLQAESTETSVKQEQMSSNYFTKACF